MTFKTSNKNALTSWGLVAVILVGGLGLAQAQGALNISRLNQIFSQVMGDLLVDQSQVKAAALELHANSDFQANQFGASLSLDLAKLPWTNHGAVMNIKTAVDAVQNDQDRLVWTTSLGNQGSVLEFVQHWAGQLADSFRRQGQYDVAVQVERLLKVQSLEEIYVTLRSVRSVVSTLIIPEEYKVYFERLKIMAERDAAQKITAVNFVFQRPDSYAKFEMAKVYVRLGQPGVDVGLGFVFSKDNPKYTKFKGGLYNVLARLESQDDQAISDLRDWISIYRALLARLMLPEQV